MPSMTSLNWYNPQFTDGSVDMRMLESQSPKVYLKPGELYFGDTAVQISTLLGSCVAITLWSDRSRCGGMSHIVVPGTNSCTVEQHPRSANGAIEFFLGYLHKYRLKPEEFQVGVFGGGHAMKKCKSECSVSIGMQNVMKVDALLKKEGFKVGQRDVGGNIYRKLSMNLENGDVWQSKHPHQLSDADKLKGVGG